MKECTKCGKLRELSEYYKCKASKDGHKSQCKSCRNESDKNYIKKNAEKIKKYREDNKERKKEYDRIYREDNKERIREYHRLYREENREVLKKYRKNYREENKEKIKEFKKEYYKNNNKKINEYYRKRYKNNPLYRLRDNLGSRTSNAFRSKGWKKNSKTQEMLGASYDVVKTHIERQFTKGMTWDNHGEWHIDHIYPLSKAIDEEHLKKLCHYTNLQPLWAGENVSKGNKIIEHQIKLRI